jgi:Zn-finger nucleic acid-binding protein
MSTETLTGHLGTAVTIDVCLGCQAFWFDRRESLQLSPRSTLALFRLIGDQAAAGRPAPGGEAAPTAVCPHCGLRLRPTQDRQRNTTFQYLRCPSDHGRFTTFYDFLREKDFIRPLSAAQLEELRRHVHAVNCSNCGASIDVTARSTCAHCGSALTMLDLAQAERLIQQLQEADRSGHAVDPALPMHLTRARREVASAFDAFEHDPGWYTSVSRSGLVGAGLLALSKWVKGH